LVRLGIQPRGRRAQALKLQLWNFLGLTDAYDAGDADGAGDADNADDANN